MRHRPDAVMLFAAGFGTRMRALTANRPKPLIPVAGRPLIDHAIDIVDDYGADTVVANVHYLPEQIRDHLARTRVTLSHEHPDILETGGGLRAAIPLLGENPVITMNTDTIWHGPNPLDLLAQSWDPAKMDALLVCVPPENAIGHSGDGDFVLSENGRVARGPGLIFGGTQIIKTDIFETISDSVFSLNVVWNKMLAEDRVFGLSYPGRWCDVGHPEGIGLAEKLLAEQDV